MQVNRGTGTFRYLITAILILLACGLFWLGAYLGREEGCCVAPEALQSQAFEVFIAIVAALSGPLAAIVAIWIALDGRREVARKEKARITALKSAMITELEHLAKMMMGISEDAEARRCQTPTALPPRYKPVRPVFEALGQDLARLPKEVTDAVSECEGIYQDKLAEFLEAQNVRRNETTLTSLAGTAKILGLQCQIYVWRMKGLSPPVSIGSVPPASQAVDFGPPVASR